MNQPQWSERYFSNEDLQTLSQAIKTAELKTSGEIIPIVVRKSSTLGHIPLLLILIFSGVSWASIDLQKNILGELPYWLIAVNFMSVFALTWIFSHFDFVGRLLTPKKDQQQQVFNRAQLEFFQAHMQNTKDQTGILLFISLFERQAIVLGDKAISEKLSNETWNEVIQTMLASINSGHLAKGLEQGVLLCGQLLTEHFPINPDDKNELPNQLIIKD